MKHECTSLIYRIIKTHKINRDSKTKPTINNIYKYIIKISKSNIKFTKILMNLNNI